MPYTPADEPVIKELLNSLPQQGQLTAITVRPARAAWPQNVEQIEAQPGRGLLGDHFSGNLESKRQVTLIQAEHLVAVASMLGLPQVDVRLTRRNLVVQGINLLALKEKYFWVGPVLLETTGLCHPCSRMEANLGPGGYNAMRGHGGLTARVLRDGLLRLGDPVRAATPEELAGI
ncbi:MAG: MOSC domain-containing protein [Bernardetiaceae bacterium]|jgi:MOSC domain-containing protein YiiM|nr:MOSC domain-containing protein [Bernardetiaceae bacterium]